MRSFIVAAVSLLVLVAAPSIDAVGQGSPATSCEPDASGVVGTWRDRIGDFWDVTMQIVEEDGTPKLILNPSASGESTIAIRRTRGCQFQNTESSDRYVITQTGSLDLYDESGFIRTAPKAP